MLKVKLISLAAAFAAVVAISVNAQQKKLSDARYIAQALSAAPPAVAKEAAVVRMEKDGSMRVLRKGTNDFTCMVAGTDKMCNDRNAAEFFEAWAKHAPPPNKLGISFMLAGDNGASNTDPYAEKKTADNHWIVTGPHIMIVGPATKTLGYTDAKDPDPKKPYVMWAGTPYEHVMLPVSAGK